MLFLIILLQIYNTVFEISKEKSLSKAPSISLDKIEISHPSERALIFHLTRFVEILHKMKEDLLPNHLTEYLYNLSEKFNVFFRDCKVKGASNMHSRLLLCELTGRHIQKGLHLLGIRTIDRM